MGSSSKDKDGHKSSSKDALKVDDAKFKDKKDKHKASEEGKVKQKKDKEGDNVKEKKSKEEKHKDKESKHKEEKRDKKDKSHKPSEASSSPALNAINSKRSAADAAPAPFFNAKKQKADDGLAVPRRSPRLSAASPKIAPAVPSLLLGANLALGPAMDSQTPQEFRAANQITVTGLGDGVLVPAPLTKFSQTPFAPNIRKSLEAAGFPTPTATQAQAWPVALSGRDVIVVAKTGSGKTLGFLLPAFHRLQQSQAGGFKATIRAPPSILVLAPTRELACQIEQEAQKFGKSSGIRSVTCYGGAPKALQIRQIRMGIEVAIATPGRMNDLLEMGCIDLSKVQFLVLDEADRMLDMGFEPQIRTIIQVLPTTRQTMMFTATWPREVQALAQEFLKTPVEIKFGEGNVLNANKNITQIIKVITEHQKPAELQKTLEAINVGGDASKLPKTIVFVSRKDLCDSVAAGLWDKGYAVDTLHGDKPQFNRTRTMEKFKRGEVKLLVATDVAARGLDVKDIEVVINYDFPAGFQGVEDYVHRIGRTARGTADGKAITFFTSGDSKRATQLIGVLKRAGQVVPEELARFDRSGGGGGGFGGGRGGGFGGGRGGFGGGRGGFGGRGGGGGFRGGAFGGRGGGGFRGGR